MILEDTRLEQLNSPSLFGILTQATSSDESKVWSK